MKARVRNNEVFVRDSRNLAILNTDYSAVKAHEAKMAHLSRQKAQEEQINRLKDDISEIKDMLAQILKSN